MPHRLDEQEHVYDDWNRKHAAAAPDCAPGTVPGANRPAGARPPCPASPSVAASAAGEAFSGQPRGSRAAWHGRSKDPIICEGWAGCDLLSALLPVTRSTFPLKW